MESKKLASVTVFRRPRKGFVPPRRANEGATTDTTNTSPKEEASTSKKKINLSPLFSKIRKKLEQDCVEEETLKDITTTFKGESVDGSVQILEPEEPFVEDGQRGGPNTVDDDDDPFSDPMDDWNGDNLEESIPVAKSQIEEFQPATSGFKKPVLFSQRSRINNFEAEVVNNLQASPPQMQQVDDKKYYGAVFAKTSTRKHKKWEGDGYIIFSKGKIVTLKNTSGKVIDSSNNYKLDSEHFEDGKVFKLGGKEVQIVEELKSDPFAKDVKPPSPEPAAIKALGKLPTPLMNKPFICPLAPGTVLTSEKANRNLSKPMFDPEAPDALVMPILDPSEDVRVVVDPHLSRHLRQHQREGVTFLYKCVMGKYYNGAILGDEMGLGKTLQTISLLWLARFLTLLKQDPYQRKEIIKRALIVCPSSLTSNWEKEFYRWLGHERIRAFAVNSDHPLKHCPPQCPVIIISYEMATRSEEALKKMKFDLIVCDEAHKIKNKNGQAYVFLSKLPCRRRILLTGTPCQNDLMELYALVDFANPGVLGPEHEFRKEYEKPIEKFQESHSTLSEKQVGQAKALQLNTMLNNFFLRRTHSVMIRYLPPRITFVVICKPSELQKRLYKLVLSSNVVQNCVTGSGNCSTPLSVILALKKLCNHPNLVHPKSNNVEKVEESIYSDLAKGFPQGHRHDLLRIEDSGKMKVLSTLLKSLQGQKVVVVSHYTQTLDLLEDLCKTFSYQFKRLDGTTIAKQRQQIVDQFNTSPNEFVFLLSSKAGGLGLNLQGASNIILYDIDWNPAHDIQAMSRCWRPGQKKLTNIYRLITSGTIEERIFHRQIAKQDLSGSVMDLLLSSSSVKFSPQDLKDIFSLYEGETCLTHDLIECDCPMDGIAKALNTSMEDFDLEVENIPVAPPPRKKLKSISTMAELHAWEHHGPPFESENLDPGLRSASKDVQFIFCSRSLPSDETN
ncbi:DNA repair and recombination protein RAD54B [Orchesella cincta]|uniref:DNA repair and recombination protein RAD54-like n=1 Tax=Orchesella cincta TaxID=48709 RepID=A0A1D2N803_ORCCI|nr:DNA repair and recombination protein RAD54B [Orchesella cincta]